MTKARIFIVEDELLTAAYLQEQLAELGYDVVGRSTTGEEAIEKIAVLHPDIVLQDIQLQGQMDGIEVAALIRQRHDISVIFLTAFSSNIILERAKITEPYGYILKPFDTRELHINVEIALYRRKMEQERKQLEDSLHQAQNTVRTLQELLPVCAWCKKIRNDQGYWERIEVFIKENLDRPCTHGVCPECNKKVLAELHSNH